MAHYPNNSTILVGGNVFTALNWKDRKKNTMDRHHSPHNQRLWTPWRMRYIGGGTREDGCIFCNRLMRHNDVQSLILHRGDHSFAIMNLFPYNTGHVMLVPNAHQAELDAVDDPTMTEMATFLPTLVSTLRLVLGCQGFNIGLNIGSVAGAGVAEHLHQHVVPRWEGDANFMPILAGTMAIPELIPSSYAKIRADLDRKVHGRREFEAVVLDDADDPSVWLQEGAIPKVQPNADQPVWRSIVTSLELSDGEIVGWSGANSTFVRDTTPGLVIRTESGPDGGAWAKIPLYGDHDPVPPQIQSTLTRVRENLARWIARPE